jgi:PAS domain S-box-containing protein
VKFSKVPRQIRIPLIYGAFSILWIILSDRLTSHIAADVNSATWIGIIKGTAFVMVSTLLIYLLLQADERRQASLQTELKLVRDSFLTLFAKNPQPMWINDLETLQFITVNDAALQIFGYSREEFLKLCVDQLIDPEEIEGLSKSLSQHIEGLRRLGPWKMTTHAEKVLYAYMVIVDIEFAGRLAHMVTVMDISEQKIIEETLKKTASERDEFEAFSFSVSHDLRASLRAVNGYSQILQEDYRDKLDQTVLGYLEKIHQASQVMNQTIDNLLMLSGIAYRKVHFTRIDLSQIAREIAGQLQKQDPQRQVSFDILPQAFVVADAELLQILLFDLMENAWKYTSKKSSAHIQVGSQLQADGELVYFVKDDGVGYDQLSAASMFKPFQRFHSAAE